MIDRRSSTRIPVAFRVHFSRIYLGLGKGTITDLAIRGCRIETDINVPVFSYLELHLLDSLSDQPLVVNLAAVRWVRGTQLGVEFLGLQSHHQTRLREMIEKANCSLPDSKTL